MVKYLLALACLCLVLGTGWAAEETRTVVDSRGVEVQIPVEIHRVVTIDYGFIEEVMFVLGEEDKIVGVGSSSCLQKVYNRTILTVDGKAHEYGDGMETVTYLYPQIRDLPAVGGGPAKMNYEALAGLDPDLIILRVGGCAFSSMNDEGVQKMIKTIEALGISVVVLKDHRCFDKPDITTISDEIRIIGNVFGKDEKANKLADYLESQMQMVSERTKDIPEAERSNVIVFGASSSARQSGGTGDVRGTDSIESYFIEEIVHAKNAFRNTGQPIVSPEQLLALNPDAIVLTTSGDYHPPEELYSAPYYQNLGDLSAIKNRRVYALPYEVCSCARLLEYPIDVMVIAKAAYPEKFDDIDLGEWLLDFYKNVYGVDDETAKELRSAQWMDWCVEN